VGHTALVEHTKGSHWPSERIVEVERTASMTVAGYNIAVAGLLACAVRRRLVDHLISDRIDPPPGRACLAFP
jgi:hypothetical protein